MGIIQIAEIVIGAMASFGILAFGGGYLMSQYKKGSGQEKSDIVSSSEKLTQFWKDQADGYKTMMEDKELAMRKEISELSTQVGELRGQLTEVTRQKEAAEKFVQGYNPELKKFMELMVKASENHDEAHNKIMEGMNKLLSMSMSNHDLLNKDLKISTTISKDGSTSTINNPQPYNRRATDLK